MIRKIIYPVYFFISKFSEKLLTCFTKISSVIVKYEHVGNTSKNTSKINSCGSHWKVAIAILRRTNWINSVFLTIVRNTYEDLV